MHPFDDLSAYLDEALSPQARASVQAHLDTCALCRTRLAELRGTARFIAALPMPVPSRSLVPRVSIPIWVAPLRTFSTFASGAAILVFLASAALSSFPRMTSFGSAPAAAPAPNTLSAPAPQASSGAEAASSTLRPQDFNAYAPSPVPAPNTDQFRAPSTQTGAAKEVGRVDASASPSVAYSSEAATRTYQAEPAQPGFAVSPWLWLVLGIAFGALSLILGRRLRSA